MCLMHWQTVRVIAAVVKAQVHAGDIAQGGGVKLLDSANAVKQTVDDMIGTPSGDLPD